MTKKSKVVFSNGIEVDVSNDPSLYLFYRIASSFKQQGCYDPTNLTEEAAVDMLCVFGVLDIDPIGKKYIPGRNCNSFLLEMFEDWKKKPSGC